MHRLDVVMEINFVALFCSQRNLGISFNRVGYLNDNRSITRSMVVKDVSDEEIDVSVY